LLLLPEQSLLLFPALMVRPYWQNDAVNSLMGEELLWDYMSILGPCIL